VFVVCDVWMEDLGLEVDFGRLERVFPGQDEKEFEAAALEFISICSYVKELWKVCIQCMVILMGPQG